MITFTLCLLALIAGSFIYGHLLKKSFSLGLPTVMLLTTVSLILLSGCQDDADAPDAPDPEPNNDRQALIALYQATDGENWTNHENWNTDAPLSQWHGIAVDTLFGAERVVGISLDMNNLQGALPDAFFDLPYLEIINLNNNNFTGGLPDAVGNLKNLRGLYAVNCNLSGVLPKGLARLQKVESIFLNSNKFTGLLPAEYAALMDRMPAFPVLKKEDLLYNCYFNFRGNQLSGKLPDAIAKHPRWNEFWTNIIAQSTNLLELPPTLPYQYDKIVFEDVEGKTFSLKERVAASELTILQFYATDPEYTETTTVHTNMMKYLLATYSGKVDVIGINWEQLYTRYDDATLARVKEFARANGIDWTQVAGNRPGNWISFLMNYIGSPQIYVLNRQGEILLPTGIKGNDNQVIDFVEQWLGMVSSYESTDYSLDGTWTKVQSATVGTDPDGVNFIITGDGFSDREMAPGGKFDRLVGETVEGYFSTEPLKSYRSYINVYALRAVSRHEGIGNGRQTAYSAYFKGNGYGVEGDNDKLYARVNAIRDFKNQFQCMIILNTPRYGGACCMYIGDHPMYSFAYTPYVNNNKAAYLPVMLHESVGHGFAFLADEYQYYPDALPQEWVNAINAGHASGYHLNLATDKNNLPWKHLVGRPEYPAVGAYEGGKYYKKGVWRSEKTSCMDDSYKCLYFNAASRELIVKRIKSLAGEEYSLDDFILRDEAGRREAASVKTRTRTFLGEQQKDYPPLPPPVIHNVRELKRGKSGSLAR